MTKKLAIALLIGFYSQSLLSQSAAYTIKKASFSTEKYDEFSPVYFGNGIVFCSTRNFGISSYSSENNNGLSKIYYIDSTDNQGVKLFSKNLTSISNDGPVTFNKRRDTIYFSRNQNINGKRNKLGIYSAVLINGEWTRIKDLRINNEWYNVTTPCLSPDGKKLFFASDMPGGYGGSDIYYSQWSGDRWEDPVNLGSVINTKGNESYPFINAEGELFFSSDGHPGLGGKDIFFSVYSDSAWQKPVRLDPPINSSYDDFGIVTDPLMKEGYFSSNRDHSVDIYHFRTKSGQILYDNIQKENQHCFLLADSGKFFIDTLRLKYVWNFGDGEKGTGMKVKHCFPGSGKYNIRLDIYDKKTGSLFFTELIDRLEIQDYIQPYINSPDIVLRDDPVRFDGLSSNLPGFNIISYSWNFRDGGKASGEKVIHAFKKKGEYLVNLELVMKAINGGGLLKTGISKKIVVFDDNNERNASGMVAPVPVFAAGKHVNVTSLYSAESEFRKDAVYYLELTSSKLRLGTGNSLFRNLPKNYSVVEKYFPDDSSYHYIVDRELSLMETYPSFNELYGLGYKNVRIRAYILKEPAEKDLNNLIKINGSSADLYFDSSDKLTSNAYIMLDQIVKFMNKYPSVKLAVVVHSDNTGPEQATLTFTQMRAQLLVSYIVNRGISSRRLVAAGYGASRPVASNDQENGRKLNRRIDFLIVN